MTSGPASRINTKHLLHCKYQQILARTPEQKSSDKKRVWTNDPKFGDLTAPPREPRLAGAEQTSNQKFQLQIQCWLKRLEFTGASEINGNSYFSQNQQARKITRTISVVMEVH